MNNFTKIVETCLKEKFIDYLQNVINYRRNRLVSLGNIVHRIITMNRLVRSITQRKITYLAVFSGLARAFDIVLCAVEQLFESYLKDIKQVLQMINDFSVFYKYI